MIKAILAAGLLAISMFLLAQEPTAVKGIDPAIQKLSTFVGGSWKATFEGGGEIRTRYVWSNDKRGLRAEGGFYKDGKALMQNLALFGFDPVAKKPYYFDQHASDELYYGHMTLEGDTLLFRFGKLGESTDQFEERGVFTDKNTYKFTMKDKSGREVMSGVYKRVRD